MKKAKDCKSVEEVKALAEKENVALTDGELEEISGGAINANRVGAGKNYPSMMTVRN